MPVVYDKDVHAIEYSHPTRDPGGLRMGESHLDTQVSGDHYKDFPIQPVEFVIRNRLGFCEGNIIKYVCRHKKKGGLSDLEKARHYIELLIELEYGRE